MNILYSVFQHRSNVCACVRACGCSASRDFQIHSLLKITLVHVFIMLAEPSRKKAYSQDIRWRVVYQRIALNLTFAKIGRNCNIAACTAHRTFSYFVQTGSVGPAMQVNRQHCRTLSKREELYFVGLVFERGSLYLYDICKQMYDLFQIEVSPPTACRILKRHGFTRKKICHVALQRSEALRGALMAHCLIFRNEMFVWADETDSDKRNAIRKLGYALRGVRPVCQRLL